jgi:hypothetical protein
MRLYGAEAAAPMKFSFRPDERKTWVAKMKKGKNRGSSLFYVWWS